MKEISLALAGNPNSGKTSLFNHITGARQRVANWGGVTVDLKEGRVRHNDILLKVVDLPGTYSLTAYSMEEMVARDYILNGHPQVVIDVVDATNLERNMYLAVQLLEMERPLVFAFNMSDELPRRGIKIDTGKLGELLGVPIIPTVGRKGKGIGGLLDTAVRVAQGKSAVSRPVKIIYGQEIEEEIDRLVDRIGTLGEPPRVPHRWLAIKLLEDDPEAEKIAAPEGDRAGLLAQAARSRAHLEGIFQEDITATLSGQRYGFIHGALQETVTQEEQGRAHSSDDIDRFVTHPVLAYLIFFAFMWILFQTTFKLGAYPMAWIEAFFAWLGDVVRASFPPGDLQGLLADGVIGGVGGVAVFLPNIMILFLGVSLLEDVGYMARAAFIMDKIMHRMGLHGKSFIPLLMGIGCSVPAIMAARTLNARSDRILTILVTPLISCSARLPVYVLFAGAFFPGIAGNIIFLMYLISFCFAFLIGMLFRKTLFRREEMPFVMELPPYRIPTINSVLIHMWQKGKHYLKKMGGVVLVFSILLWFLGAYPKAQEAADPGEAAPTGASEGLGHTYIGMIGRGVEPIMRPLGFDWRMSVSLLTGFVAKEVVVSAMGVLYQVGGETGGGVDDVHDMTGGGRIRQAPDLPPEKSWTLKEALKANYTPLQGFAFMLFVLLYTPCVVALVTMVRELRSVKWSVFGICYQICLAWIAAFLVYQGGKALGWA
jgi:ferrous iron transport protein B